MLKAVNPASMPPLTTDRISSGLLEESLLVLDALTPGLTTLAQHASREKNSL